MPRELYWTEERINKIRMAANEGLDLQGIASRLGKGYYSIKKIVSAHKIKINGPRARWSDDEIRTLREMMADNKTWGEISAALPHRSESAVSRYARSEGFVDISPQKVWGTSDIETLIRLRSSGMLFREVGKKMGCSEGCVKYRYTVLPYKTRKMIDKKFMEKATKRRTANRVKAKIEENAPVRYDSWGRGPLVFMDRESAEELIALIFTGEITEKQAQRAAG